MDPKRALSAFRHLNRLPEVYRCARRAHRWPALTMAFLKIRPLSYPYTLTLRNGQQLTLADWADLTTAWVVLFGNEYIIQPSDRLIIDLGANIGTFCLLAAAEAPQARIIALEPFPRNRERLKQTLAENDLTERVMVLPYAASDSDGQARMGASEDVPNHSRRLAQPDTRSPVEEAIDVQTVSLASLFQQEGIDRVDFLKMDIEGAEYQVLPAAPDQVLQRVQRIGFEYHESGDPATLWKKLESAGFRCTRHPKQGPAGVAEFRRVQD